MGAERRAIVVGAGAAGLSFARTLAARDIPAVVLEAEDRVGGKCKTLEHAGRRYDLGANFTTPRYRRVRALADEVGLTREPLGPRRIVSVTGEEPPRVGAVRGWLLEAARAWYVWRRARTGIDRDGFCALSPAVREPFRDWLRKGGLGPVAEVFDALFTAYGYGPVSTLSAAYGLKFFDPIHLRAAVDVVRGRTVHTTTDFVEGFQALWERQVDRWNLDVRLGARVVGVERSASEVAVRYAQDGQEREERGTDLVLACPLHLALDFLDATEVERRLFSRIRHFDYRVVAATTSGLPDISTYLYPWSQRYTPGRVMAFYKPQAGDPEQVFLFYAYGDDGISDDAILDDLRDTLARPPFTARVERVLAVQRWTYFPHFSVDDVRAGAHDELEGLQGARRTWYAGELLSFPLVELVVRHAEALARKGFPRPGRDP